MVTMVTEKRVISYPEAKAEYDGHWFLFYNRDFPPEEDMGYVVAYGDDTDKDWEALERMQMKQYKGKILLLKGWAQKDDIYDSGIIEEV